MNMEAQVADWGFKALIAVMSGAVVNTTILSFLIIVIYRQSVHIERLDVHMAHMREDIALLMGSEMPQRRRQADAD